MRRPLAVLSLALLAATGFRTSSAQADARAEVLSGGRLLEAGRWSEAEEAYARATRAAPGMVSAWLGLGDARARRGDFERAQGSLATAIRLAPQDTAAPLLLARIHLASDSPARATEIARGILARNPGEAGAIRILGFSRWAEGDAEEAERFFRLALRRDPRDADASFGLALARETTGDTLAVLSALRAAIAADPGHSAARRHLAWILESIGRPREAEAEYRAVVTASDGTTPTDALDLARLLSTRGAASEAESVLRSSMTPVGDPASARVFFARGIILERAGDLAGARDLFRAATLGRPEDPVARARFEDLLAASLPPTDSERIRFAARRLAEARVARAEGDLSEAERLLRRAVRLAPQVSEIRLEKARLLAKRNSFADALQEAFWARELTRDAQERFQIADAEERWVAAGLDRLETTTLASFRDLRLAPFAARRDFLRDPAALETRLDWLPGPWPRPRVVLRLEPFLEAVPPYHVEIGRTFDRFMEESLREREEIEVRSGAAMTDAPYDVRVLGEIVEKEDEVRIRFRLERSNGERILERTLEARGLDAFARASSAMARALLAAVEPRGEILRMEGGAIFVNLGARNGLRPGDTLVVVGPRAPSRIPGIGRPGLEVRGRLLVTAVEDRFARAVETEGSSAGYGILSRVRRDEP